MMNKDTVKIKMITAQTTTAAPGAMLTMVGATEIGVAEEIGGTEADGRTDDDRSVLC